MTRQTKGMLQQGVKSFYAIVSINKCRKFPCMMRLSLTLFFFYRPTTFQTAVSEGGFPWRRLFTTLCSRRSWRVHGSGGGAHPPPEVCVRLLVNECTSLTFDSHHVLLSLARFRCVNIIAVRKICVKHDRLLSNRMMGDYYHKKIKEQYRLRQRGSKRSRLDRSDTQPQFGALLSKPVALESTGGYILGICKLVFSSFRSYLCHRRTHVKTALLLQLTRRFNKLPTLPLCKQYHHRWLSHLQILKHLNLVRLVLGCKLVPYRSRVKARRVWKVPN